eukprot:gb/GFBE01041090.1/.p1 GENE.gb/GFBE01041090.1/~~gb/GFBE01041090.1/.p1  ORF type:complete len:488 (+),score=101.93 gb/GFBE01041090.1/:1-1464(+)
MEAFIFSDGSSLEHTRHGHRHIPARGVVAAGFPVSQVLAAPASRDAHGGSSCLSRFLLAAGCASVAARRRSPAASQRRARGGESAARLAPEDAWISTLDLEGFGREVRELGKQLEAEQGQDDVDHLKKIVFWSDLCAVVGLSTMWLAPNPVAVLALSLWTHSRWTMIGHHICHGGYNRTDDTGRYSSRGFALGSLVQRVTDWFDWMLPEAWNMEHNQLHHYRLGEEADPDLVERNVLAWGGLNKDVMTFLSMLVWKWYYYAPNTYKELKLAEMQRKGQRTPEGFDPQKPMTLVEVLLDGDIFSFWELFSGVIGPYLLLRFLVLPLPLALFSPDLFASAVINLVLAELLSNLHAFVVITTNHAGSDLYRFERGCKPKSPTFYLRAVTSSTNFRTGDDVNDFFHGWLNYQIEHHVWPDLSMLAYQKGQPKLQELCRKHGVPYVQEDVFTRLGKTLDIFTGRDKMRRFPDHLERQEDMIDWSRRKQTARA